MYTLTYCPKFGEYYTARLNKITMGAIFDQEYGWNEAGDLTWRKDNIHHNSLGNPLTENFTYDGLSRLTDVNLNGLATFSATYNVLGGMTTEMNTGTYNYSTVNPYCLDNITTTSPGKISEFRQTLEYSSFNKTASVEENDWRLEISYGVTRDRIKQSLYHDDGSGTMVLSSRKYFIGGICEKVVSGNDSKWIDYISCPEGLLALQITENGNSPQWYYTANDHLGSICALVHNDGTVAQAYSYDAWGTRRDPLTWINYSGNWPECIIDRGYTGHEHLDMFRLINMNGRMYDPIVGRFLSTDAFVQAPGFTQSYNRYSYCLNNPLMYTDPSGNFWFVPLIVGFVSNYVITGITTDDWGWKAVGNGLIGAGTALVGYGFGMAASSFASTSLGMSTAGASFFGSAIGGAASGAFGSMATGQNIGRGALVGLGGGLLGGGLSGLEVNNIGLEALINVGAGGLYGGVVSELTGGSFAEGFKTGAISSAVGWGVNRGMRQYLAKSEQRAQAMARAKEILNIKEDFMNNELETWTDRDYMKQYEDSDVNQKWAEVVKVWNETYGAGKNLKLSNNFDLKAESLKFNNLHVRLEKGIITYHCDYVDIVRNPLGHIVTDTLFQGFWYWNW